MNNLFNEDDVFSWTNRKEAEVYIGKEGYLANSLEALNKIIIHERTYTLKDVSANVSCFIENEHGFSFGLFLPADRVKHPEKKWRAFRDTQEITETLKLDRLLGSQITFRRKTDTSKFYIGLVTREYFVENTPEKHYLKGISIDGRHYNLDDLYENYEWLANVYSSQPWRPFGVEK